MKFTFPDCGGCQSCQLACSYHLTGEFNPSAAAIEIKERAGGGYEVTLHEGPSQAGNPCDGCAGLDMPFCVRYCHARQALMECVSAMRIRLEGKDGE